MLKIHLLTGLAWTQEITVEGDEHSDLLQCIDDYYAEYGELPVAMYEPSKLDAEKIETYIPINGGQFYIEGISHIEVI